MPKKKKKTKALALPKKKSWYVRKRDKVVVRVEDVTRASVEYCTMPLLLVYGTTPAAFHLGFRPATEDEIAQHNGALP